MRKGLSNKPNFTRVKLVCVNLLYRALAEKKARRSVRRCIPTLSLGKTDEMIVNIKYEIEKGKNK